MHEAVIMQVHYAAKHHIQASRAGRINHSTFTAARQPASQHRLYQCDIPLPLPLRSILQ